MSRLCLALVALLAGCATYDPPVDGDRGSAKYKADLARCQTEASRTASRKANATPSTAFMALFGSGEQERQDLTICMQAHGFARRAG